MENTHIAIGSRNYIRMELSSKKIYIASKTKHADKWIALKESGVNIISSWIYKVGNVEDAQKFCQQVIKECLSCDALVVYAEEGEVQEGVLVEIGIVLARQVTNIYLVGNPFENTSLFLYSSKVIQVSSLEEAIKQANAAIY